MLLFLFIPILLIPATRGLNVGDRFFLSDEIAAELEDWELKWLKDAVRGRGRAIISRANPDEKVVEDVFESDRPTADSHPIAATENSFLGSFESPQSPPLFQFGSTDEELSFGNMGAAANLMMPVPGPGFQPFQVIMPPAPGIQQVRRPATSDRLSPTRHSKRVITTPSPTTTTTRRPATPTPRRQGGASKEKEEIGVNEFNALTNILQHLISRRKGMLAEAGDDYHDDGAAVTSGATFKVPAPATPRTAIRTTSISQQHTWPPPNVITATSHSPAIRGRTTIPPPPASGHIPGHWTMMNPEEPDPEVEHRSVPQQLPDESLDAPSISLSSHTDPKDPEESELTRLSQQLATLINRMKRNKKSPVKKQRKPERPRVIVIRNGTAEGVADRQYNLVSTITLIRDGRLNVLVDTGLATDINARTSMLRRMEEAGVPAPAVNVVVSTHGHPDHAGNTHEFPDAMHFHSWFMHERGIFNLSDLFENDRHHISNSISLIRVPGHTSEDIAVLIRDAEGMGNVAVAGDVFIRQDDIDNSNEWTPLSANQTQQAIARKILICKSDWIVPGHGEPFHVDENLRRYFKC